MNVLKQIIKEIKIPLQILPARHLQTRHKMQIPSPRKLPKKTLNLIQPQKHAQLTQPQIIQPPQNQIHQRIVF